MEKSPECSPEFEFWMVGNPPPSFPNPQHLLTADELFADGVILPLNPNPNPNSSPPHEPQPPPPTPPPQRALFPSKKWRQIFRSSRGTKEKAKIANTSSTSSSSSSSSSVSSAAELNIHIWPFSRSRSAGNAAVPSGSRPRASASGRKSCSAPCSRSNSRGETPPPTASKRWGPLAGGGIPVGRSAPVWQLRRAGGNGIATNNNNNNNNAKKSNVLNLNVNTCIGYGSQARNCRGEDKEQLTGGDRTAGDGGSGSGGGGNGSLFNLRAMFSKKVY